MATATSPRFAPAPNGFPRPVFSLADLEAHDPRAPRREGERRFGCPLCGGDKPLDAAHRSLCANTQSGAWNCKRCGAAGKLAEFWSDRLSGAPGGLGRRASRSFGRDLARARRLQASALRPCADASGEAPGAVDWRAQLHTLSALADTPGEAYLSGRGVALETAMEAGGRFCPSWFGRAAVVFPVRDKGGALVAASGRYLDGRDNPKARSAGPKSAGVFLAPCVVNGRRFAPLDARAPAIIITEAPIDALSLATCGFPAIALNGTTGPAWLHLACGLRRVLLAFDADEAGDRAAGVLADFLAPYGARCERLRPEGFKDWNEALQASGRDAMGDLLAPRVLIEATATPPATAEAVP